MDNVNLELHPVLFHQYASHIARFAEEQQKLFSTLETGANLILGTLDVMLSSNALVPAYGYACASSKKFDESMEMVATHHRSSKRKLVEGYAAKGQLIHAYADQVCVDLDHDYAYLQRCKDDFDKQVGHFFSTFDDRWDEAWDEVKLNVLSGETEFLSRGTLLVSDGHGFYRTYAYTADDGGVTRPIRTKDKIAFATRGNLELLCHGTLFNDVDTAVYALKRIYEDIPSTTIVSFDYPSHLLASDAAYAGLILPIVRGKYLLNTHRE